MKHENVRIGMRVVPHQKTVPGWLSLERSNVWEEAKSMGQPYLYVNGFENDENAWVLGTQNIESLFGDYFFAEDFNLYGDDTWMEGLILPSKSELAAMDANAEELLEDFTGA